MYSEIYSGIQTQRSELQSGISQAQQQRTIVQQRLSQAQTQRTGLAEKRFSPMHKQYRGTQIQVEREQARERAKQREYLSGYEYKAKEHLGEISEYESKAEGYIGELGERETKIKGYEKEGYTPEKTDEGYSFGKTVMVRQQVRHKVSSGMPEVSQKLIWEKPVQRGGKTIWERRTTQVSNIHLKKALSQVAGYGGRVVEITSMADPGSKHYKYTYEYKPVTTTKKEIFSEKKGGDIEDTPVFSLGAIQQTSHEFPEIDKSVKKAMDARALWAGGAITGGTATTEFMMSQPGFEQKLQKYAESQPGHESDPYKKTYYIGKTPEGENIYAPKTPSLIDTGRYTTDPDWKTVETQISKGLGDINLNLPMLKSQLEMLKGVPSSTEFEFDLNQDNIIQDEEKMTAGELIPVVKGYISETEKSREELLKSRSMLGKYKELGYEVNIADDELSLVVPGEKGSVEYEKEADIQRIMESGTPVQRVASMAKFWSGGFTSQDPFWTKSMGEALFGEEKGKSERLFETRVKAQVALRKAKETGGIIGVYKEMYKPGSPAFAITAAAIGGKVFGLGMGGIAGMSPTLGTVASATTGGYFMYRAGTEIASLAISGYGMQWGGALGLAPAGLATTTAEGESIGPSPVADRFSSIAMIGISAPFAIRAYGSGFKTAKSYVSNIRGLETFKQDLSFFARRHTPKFAKTYLSSTSPKSIQNMLSGHRLIKTPKFAKTYLSKSSPKSIQSMLSRYRFTKASRSYVEGMKLYGKDSYSYAVKHGIIRDVGIAKLSEIKTPYEGYGDIYYGRSIMKDPMAGVYTKQTNWMETFPEYAKMKTQVYRDWSLTPERTQYWKKLPYEGYERARGFRTPDYEPFMPSSIDYKKGISLVGKTEYAAMGDPRISMPSEPIPGVKHTFSRMALRKIFSPKLLTKSQIAIQDITKIGKLKAFGWKEPTAPRYEYIIPGKHEHGVMFTAKPFYTKVQDITKIGKLKAFGWKEPTAPRYEYIIPGKHEHGVMFTAKPFKQIKTYEPIERLGLPEKYPEIGKLTIRDYFPQRVTLAKTDILFTAKTKTPFKYKTANVLKETKTSRGAGQQTKLISKSTDVLKETKTSRGAGQQTKFIPKSTEMHMGSEGNNISDLLKSTQYPIRKSGWAGTSLAELEAMEYEISGVHSHWKGIAPSISLLKPSIMIGDRAISMQPSESLLDTTLISQQHQQQEQMSLLDTMHMQGFGTFNISESLLDTTLISQQHQQQEQMSALDQAFMQELLLSPLLMSKQEQRYKQVQMYKTPLVSVPRTPPILDILPQPSVSHKPVKPVIPFIPFLDNEETPKRRVKKRKPKKRKRGYRERKHPVGLYDIFGGM